MMKSVLGGHRPLPSRRNFDQQISLSSLLTSNVTDVCALNINNDNKQLCNYGRQNKGTSTTKEIAKMISWMALTKTATNLVKLRVLFQK